MNSENIKKVTNQAIEQLVEALQAGKSEALTNYLAAVAKFHHYSFQNILLIARQCPQATRVAGFHTWRTLGRFVKKGEKGLMILAPLVRKAESADSCSTEKESQIFGFRAVYVFDVSQTDGAPLPTIGVAQGEPGAYFARLEQLVREQGISLEYSSEIAPAKGMSCGKKIFLLPGMAPAEQFSTLVHELAHEMLHRDARRTQTLQRARETEAEAIAFVVGKAVGLETGSAAADYISLYTGDATLLLESLEYVQKTSTQILSAINSEAPPS
jgi:antirestriction protein ArdC